jgi:hypothetical protein
MQASATTSANTGRWPAGLFLVREESARGRPLLVAHTFTPLSGPARRSLEQMGAARDAACQVIVHKLSRLKSATCLADIDQRFAGGSIVFDPTGVMARTSAIVHCGKAVRAALGARLDKLLFDSERRTLFVVLDPLAFKERGADLEVAAGQAMRIVAATFEAWRRQQPSDFDIAVRVGFDAPAGALVTAVDAASAPRPIVRRIGRSLHRLRLAVGLAALGAVSITAPAFAQSTGVSASAQGEEAAPVGKAADISSTEAAANSAAVDGISGSVVLMGGNADGGDDHKSFGAIGGVLTVPLGSSFGFQAEGAVGSGEESGAGAHLFWRDPDRVMVGAFVAYDNFWQLDQTRVGVEGELYLDRFTVGGQVGYLDREDQDGAFGRADVGFYVTPNFVVRAGWQGAKGQSDGVAGIEFQPAPEALPGLSVFAQGQAGKVDAIMGGIKVHFGAKASTLMYRDRHEQVRTTTFEFIPPAPKHHAYGTGGGGSPPPI